MLKRNIVCWFGWHNFNKDFCRRCGLARELLATPIFDQPKGATQFLEAGTDKERFKEAKNINDLLKNG